MAPHLKEGVSGPELMELMRQQARNFGTRIITEDIADVDFSGRPFGLTASDGNVYQAARRDRGHRRPGELSRPALGREI